MLLGYLLSAIDFGLGKTINHWQKVFLVFKLRVSDLFIAKFNIQETFRYAPLILERDFFFFLVSVKSSSLISIHYNAVGCSLQRTMSIRSGFSHTLK